MNFQGLHDIENLICINRNYNIKAQFLPTHLHPRICFLNIHSWFIMNALHPVPYVWNLTKYLFIKRFVTQSWAFHFNFSVYFPKDKGFGDKKTLIEGTFVGIYKIYEEYKSRIRITYFVYDYKLFRSLIFQVS